MSGPIDRFVLVPNEASIFDTEYAGEESSVNLFVNPIATGMGRRGDYNSVKFGCSYAHVSKGTTEFAHTSMNQAGMLDYPCEMHVRRIGVFLQMDKSERVLMCKNAVLKIGIESNFQLGLDDGWMRHYPLAYFPYECACNRVRERLGNQKSPYPGYTNTVMDNSLSEKITLEVDQFWIKPGQRILASIDKKCTVCSDGLIVLALCGTYYTPDASPERIV